MAGTEVEAVVDSYKKWAEYFASDHGLTPPVQARAISQVLLPVTLAELNVKLTRSGLLPVIRGLYAASPQGLELWLRDRQSLNWLESNLDRRIGRVAAVARHIVDKSVCP